MAGARWEDYGDFLTLPQVAKLLQIGRSTAYDLAAKGQLPVVRISSGIVRVPKAALMEQLAGEEQGRRTA